MHLVGFIIQNYHDARSTERQKKQENIVLNTIMIKLKWKYLPQIYTARFLCSVTSEGPQGRICARMVLPNTTPLQKPRCSKENRMVYVSSR